MKTFLLATVLTMGPIAASAAPILIDDFRSTQVVADRPVEGFPRRSETFGPTVIGGQRELVVKTLNRGGPFATTLSSNQADEELLNFSNQSNQRGVGTVRYDGKGQSGLGGVDLLVGGASSGFEFVVENADAELTIAVTVQDTEGGVSLFEKTFPQEIKSQSVDLLFDDFDGTASFAAIDAIEFAFSGPQDLDASFERILVSAVPLPASGLLLGAAAVGLIALRRRMA